MLVKENKKISKAIYDNIIENNNIINDDILCKVFNECMLYGYGIYNPVATKCNDDYYIEYYTSNYCD